MDECRANVEIHLKQSVNKMQEVMMSLMTKKDRPAGFGQEGLSEVKYMWITFCL